MPPMQDESGLSPPRKNQHVTASNTVITFGCLAKLDDIDIGMLLTPLTAGISAGLMGIAYESILQDADIQVCTIIFAQPVTAALAALELNTNGLQEITTAVITCEALPPMPPNWGNKTIFEPFVKQCIYNVAYCIVQGCAHHNLNGQATFSTAKKRVYHWNKYHQDIQSFILASGPEYLTFFK